MIYRVTEKNLAQWENESKWYLTVRYCGRDYISALIEWHRYVQHCSETMELTFERMNLNGDGNDLGEFELVSSKGGAKK